MKIRHRDNPEIVYTVYGTLGNPNTWCALDSLQFLVFDPARDKWALVYATDYIPVEEG